MRKRFVAIYAVLVVALILLAAFVPSCTPTTGTIVVKATLCGNPWQGAVSYTLSAGNSTISGISVPTTHTDVAAGTWSCAYNSGGPAGAFLKSIKPLATQSLTAGGTITFTLDFELNQDAAIKFLHWTLSGEPQGPQPTEIVAVPCNFIDAHFLQWVDGCEGYNVTMNETSWLNITQMMGPPGVVVYVVNDDCAVNKTPGQGLVPPVKKFQVPTFNGTPVEKGMNTTLTPGVPTLLDVETQWQLVKDTNYTKSINWFGIWVGAYEPGLHPCVLFELILPVPNAQYVFIIQTSADVALVGDTDLNPANNHDMSAPVGLVVNVP
jgi:hypothetical protein